MKPSLDRVVNLLPTPPDNFSYSVEQMSPLVIRVWLHHHQEYVYKEGEPVRTIYCFVKGDKVYPPKNHKTSQSRSVCGIMELYKQPNYTTIKPKTNSLLHLM